MTGTIDISVSTELEKLAEQNSCAISLIDASRSELETFNNNSICSELNPDDRFSAECDEYCGKAYDSATSTGGAVSYRCHAGLDCRAVPIAINQQPLVAIIGRTFTNASKYREATERAISGDWRKFPPNSFFGNVLMGGTERDIEKTVDAVSKLLPARRPSLDRASAILSEQDTKIQVPRPEISEPSGDTSPEPAVGPSPISDLRSFIGSILKMEYADAAEAALELISRRYSLSSLLWLRRNVDKLEHFCAYGKMKGRRIRLSIPANDERLVAAMNEGRPLEIRERKKGATDDHARTMILFPIGVGAEISSAVAILDRIDDGSVTADIARLCRTISHQFEILRLRTEVARGDSLSAALRRFGESLKSSHTDDLWFTLTRSAAELLKGSGVLEMWTHLWPILVFMAVVLGAGLKAYRRTLD